MKVVRSATARYATYSGPVHLSQIVPERFRGITGEAAKFGIIGVVNIVVNFAVVNLMLVTVLKGSELKANAVGVIVSATSAYFMNRHWTYRDRPKSTLRREYSLFFFFNLIGLIIQVGTVAFTKYALHETHILAINVSTGVGIALGTLFRFWSYRTHVFKVEATEPEPEAPVALAASLADAPDVPAEDEVDEESEPAAVEPVEPSPRLVITSSAGGSVVIKVLSATDDPQEIDEIDMDDPVRASS
jgi:putative flippase GtrA